MSQKPAPKSPDSAEGAPAAEAPPVIDGAKESDGGGPPPKAPAPVAVANAPYTVAPGKSLTTPRGVVDQGQEITLQHFPGLNDANASEAKHNEARQAALDHLVKQGFVIKR
jgi:hypothetical protein